MTAPLATYTSPEVLTILKPPQFRPHTIPKPVTNPQYEIHREPVCIKPGGSNSDPSVQTQEFELKSQVPHASH